MNPWHSCLCSEEQLRKKASVLFGIRFDDNKYSELKKHLDTIKGNKDLVCGFSFEKKNIINWHAFLIGIMAYKYIKIFKSKFRLRSQLCHDWFGFMFTDFIVRTITRLCRHVQKYRNELGWNISQFVSIYESPILFDWSKLLRKQFLRTRELK